MAECTRCETILREPKQDSLARTAAFSLAALIFYVPANTYPILHMEYLGRSSESTIVGGCIELFKGGSWGVALIVFCASILIPLLKLLALFYLVLTVRFGFAARDRLRIYNVIEKIGRWSMLDVFLLSVMVGLVRLGNLATVRPGPGLAAFAAVVILTLLASGSFEPRLLWDEDE